MVAPVPCALGRALVRGKHSRQHSLSARNRILPKRDLQPAGRNGALNQPPRRTGHARRRARARQLPAATMRQDSAKSGWELGPLGNFIGFQLRRAQDVSFRSFARRVGESDLHPGKFALLAVIGINPGINQSALSHATGRDKSTLTPALRDLMARGWVRRERDTGDRRAWALQLTPAGAQRLQMLTVHAEQHDRELDAIVGERHKTLLLQLLERIVHELDQRELDGAR
ncbi:MAG: MarR family transcriptional regulator [Gammaproteobacteria bacterium]|nr:MarR family transcriptional regulator [Gammaproteobacteria bacterium]